MDQLDCIIQERVTVTESSIKFLLKRIQGLTELCKGTTISTLDTFNSEISNGFDELQMLIGKFQLQHSTSFRELSAFDERRLQIRESYDRGKEASALLEEELVEARLRRAHMEEYDQFTKAMIYKEHLKSRAEQLKAVENLEEEIKELELQKNSYAKVWEVRKQQFAEIVEALHSMQQQIREEKEEQERREGMDEGEAEPDSKDNVTTGGINTENIEHSNGSRQGVPTGESQLESNALDQDTSKADSMDLS
ncbi:uncharacterized protein V1510DRAFT_418316 [Dipodascopsis tothii]|uniref:uncharacterized protein n=1 Tax=Dipodascopsis tothii TaxID=44089 RepID=UPI0034CF00B6